MTPSTVLFLAANPIQVQALQLGEECRLIEQMIRAAKYRDRIRFRSRWAARPDDLLQALNEDAPSILHFSGHGSGDRGLYFQSEDGGASTMSAEGLVRIIRAAGTSVVVVVLNACFSEVQAQALIAHVPCVIGMSNAIADAAAIRYAGAFYRALAYGKSVANAHEQGLAALASQSADRPTRDIEPEGAVPCAPSPRLLTRRDIDAKSICIVNLSNAKRHCEIRIKATLKEFDAEIIARVTEELRQITGDFSLEILDIEEGSIRLTISLSLAALKKLIQLKNNGQLNKIYGFKILTALEVADAETEPSPSSPARTPISSSLPRMIARYLSPRPRSNALRAADSDESTITSISVHRGKTPSGQDVRDQLILLATSDDPRIPSSRHVLDDIDVVRFRRGPREVERHVDGTQRVLTIRVPDRRVSMGHGSMRRVQGSWLLDDPTSHNGVVVNGTVTRRTMLGDDALIELGHTFFLLRIGPLEKDAPLDVDETALRAPTQALATFEGGLAERFAALARVAPQSNVVILLLGETGTGKEVVARALHELSGRRGAFVGVNCGALPTTLVEAELFGHKRGAYTGAITDRPGLVRSAEGGTLLLDEIGELPVASQAALLRVIADRTVTPVGDDRPVPVDVRLCAATLRDLSALVEAGGFRRDLYARLVGFKLRLPALRDRRADFGLLLRARLAEAPGGDRVTFTPGALRALFRYDWPLNIRELDSVVQRAVALTPDGVIDTIHLELHSSIAPSVRGSSPDASGGSRAPAALAAPAAPAAPDAPLVEDGALRERLVELLTEHRGNVKLVAHALGRRRMHVYRWVQRFGLDLERFRR